MGSSILENLSTGKGMKKKVLDIPILTPKQQGFLVQRALAEIASRYELTPEEEVDAFLARLAVLPRNLA